jgi:glucose-6-phosphate dehydrogenase assembly protein OpcA
MAGTVADRAWKMSTPESIEADLAALWRELAGGSARIARAVMSNLIVFRGRAAPPGADIASIAADLPLDDVAARHPSRMIVIEHCDDKTPGAPFAAGVGIVTFGPPQARYGIEQIVIRSACPDASLLSILRRFVRGDLPTTVWCTDDVSAHPPPEPLLEVVRQLLYDSRRWRDVRRGAAALASIAGRRGIDVADMNWRRLTPLRRALVDARGPLDEPTWRETGIRIAYVPDEEALAWLCVGWLRSEGLPNVSLESPASVPGEHQPILTLRAGDLTARLTDRTVDIVSASASPLRVGIRVEAEADAVAAELRTLTHDASLVAALQALQR